MHLIIGYGNSLRCDDGLGQYLAQKLEGCWEVITSIQLTPEFAEPISRAERVVFIDAKIGETPGDVMAEGVKPLPAAGAFTHNVTPASLLAASLELYGHMPEALLISIVGASFGYGCDFSPQISAMLPQITETADEKIATFFRA